MKTRTTVLCALCGSATKTCCSDCPRNTASRVVVEATRRFRKGWTVGTGRQWIKPNRTSPRVEPLTIAERLTVNATVAPDAAAAIRRARAVLPVGGEQEAGT